MVCKLFESKRRPTTADMNAVCEYDWEPVNVVWDHIAECWLIYIKTGPVYHDPDILQVRNQQLTIDGWTEMD